MRVGLNLPQYEIDFGGSPERIAQAARAAEDAGFDSVWVSDHPFAVAPDGTVSGALDALVAMAYVAAATHLVTVGSLVLACSLRSVEQIVAAARAFAQIAPDRIVVGLGAGWFAPEHRAYGEVLPPLKERLTALEETAAAAHDTGVEILIGGTGEGLLDIAAREADIWNCAWDVAPADVAKLSGVLDEKCARAGRSVRRSVGVSVLVADSREAAERAVEAVRARAGFLRSLDLGSLERTVIVGDAETCARRIAAYGVDEVVVTPFVRDDLDMIRAIGERVVPLLRS